MKELKTVQSKPANRLRMNKQLYIILICFSISSIFWLLLALSHDYPSKITLPVKYINLPGKKVVMNEMPANILVQFKTSGFKIISFGFQKNHPPVEVDVASSLSVLSLNSEVLALPTQTFLEDFSKELGKDVTITGFQPDSIIFNFSDIITKKIPVFLSLQLSFEKQYDTTGSPEISPFEIEVSGPPSIVQKMKNVKTETVKLENVKGPVKMKAKLMGSRLITFNTDQIEFNIPVEKFTEGSANVDINPVNVRSGYSLKTFPEKVKVLYLVALSQYNKVEDSMFDAVIDANNLKEKQTSKLDVNVITSPSFVRITKLEPDKVDYILRKQ